MDNMRLMYLSDIHGNFNIINQYLKRFDITNANIIQIGDFGVGFHHLPKEKRALEYVNNELVKRNVYLYAIRGNHDRPDYFDNDPFGFSNIKLVKDYTVLNLSGKNILCIGGAISIDRSVRYTKAQIEGDFEIKGNEQWWVDETFNYKDELLRDLRNIDILVTHTSPDYCWPDNSNGFAPIVNDFASIDKNLKTELLEERRNMTLAFQTIKMNNDIEYAYYGHFHANHVTEIYGTKHRVLGVGELWEEKGIS
jgi:predicted phosphodiesterase